MNCLSATASLSEDQWRRVKVDVRVVGIAGLHLDYPRLIAEELSAQGLRCETHTIPFFPIGGLRHSVLRELRSEIARTPPGAVSIYCSGAAEYYLRAPDISVHFSGYRSWFRSDRMRIVAHPWLTAEPLVGQSLVWKEKPPFTIGFMGTGYVNSRPSRLASAMPMPSKQRLLGGQYLRFADVLAVLYAARVPFKYAATFPRIEAIRAIEDQCSKAGATVTVVDTGGFTGSSEQIERYARHMGDATYVLCPRGAENYSYRLYEALKFGRVPVLIDTEMVLPEGVPWDELIVRVPYSRLSEIGEIVSRDYEHRTSTEFIARQKLAIQTMTELQDGGWATGLVNDVRRFLAAKSSPYQAGGVGSGVKV